MRPNRNGNMQQAGGKKKAAKKWLLKFEFRYFLNPNASDQADETC